MLACDLQAYPPEQGSISRCVATPTCSKAALTRDKPTAFGICQLLKWQALAAIDCNTSSMLCTSSAAFAYNFSFHVLSHGMRSCTRVVATQDCMYLTRLKDIIDCERERMNEHSHTSGADMLRI